MPPHLPPPGMAETLLLEGSAGLIETLIAMPAAAPGASAGGLCASYVSPAASPSGIAVICHPHPLHGGALSNKVTYTLAASALKCGLVAARFNFRGVGKSEGVHDEGRGETDDTLAVIAWLRERLPGKKLLLAGFSFGAFVSLKAAASAKPALQISIAPPFKYFASEPLPQRLQAPWLVVHARDDEVVDFDETHRVLAQYQPPPELVTLETAGHFFHGKLGELQQIVTGFIERSCAGI